MVEAPPSFEEIDLPATATSCGTYSSVITPALQTMTVWQATEPWNFMSWRDNKNSQNITTTEIFTSLQEGKPACEAGQIGTGRSTPDRLSDLLKQQ